MNLSKSPFNEITNLPSCLSKFLAITGNGQASKEQVADMLKRMLHIPESDMLPFMDATDGLAAAYCHYLQMGRPTLTKEYSGWKDFINKNPYKIKR